MKKFITIFFVVFGFNMFAQTDGTITIGTKEPKQKNNSIGIIGEGYGTRFYTKSQRSIGYSIYYEPKNLLTNVNSFIPHIGFINFSNQSVFTSRDSITYKFGIDYRRTLFYTEKIGVGIIVGSGYFLNPPANKLYYNAGISFTYSNIKQNIGNSSNGPSIIIPIHIYFLRANNTNYIGGKVYIPIFNF